MAPPGSVAALTV